MPESPDLALNKSRAAAALTQSARQVHQWVLTTFARTGRAPLRTDIEQMARDCDIDPESTMTELVTADVLAVDAHGEIRAAYPFSPTPTDHLVTPADGHIVHAMCAVDALGMSAMLGQPVTITTTEPGTGAAITIHVDRDHAAWSPATTVVFAGTTDDTCCPSVDRTCHHINFFTTPDAAHRWAATHPELTGTVLDQHQALACGIAEFGTLLHPTPTPEPRTAAELAESDSG